MTLPPVVLSSVVLLSCDWVAVVVVVVVVVVTVESSIAGVFGRREPVEAEMKPAAMSESKLAD